MARAPHPACRLIIISNMQGAIAAPGEKKEGDKSRRSLVTLN
jgi:hypothetical protein